MIRDEEGMMLKGLEENKKATLIYDENQNALLNIINAIIEINFMTSYLFNQSNYTLYQCNQL